MKLNEELRTAWDFVEHTGVSIFLTGKAGTGKTTFLRAVREHSAKTIVVVAPTGVAAINAGGVTIHSFFQLPLSPFVPGSEIKEKFNFSNEKRKIIRSIDLLVIDEISMVRSDLLDAIDYTLRKYRSDSRPFGGVQLLMIGDLQQLTPVVTPEDAPLLDRYYTTPYFFGSHALQSTPYVTIQLTQVFRQNDETFVRLLNNIRNNCPSPDDFRLLNARWNPAFRPSATEGYIRLTTHNNLADAYNANELAALSTPPFTYLAEVEGTFPSGSFPTADRLTLKVGAQVMFVKNDFTPEHRYYNGKIGHVVEATENTLSVLCPGESEAIEVVPAEWENARYTVNEKTHEVETEVLGVFRQLPLRPAWAITIHKSQGLTFDKAIIDAGQAFAPGQVYVALSRCKTLEGMVLATRIEPHAILTDSNVSAYIGRQEAEAAESIERLPGIKADYFRQLLMELFTFVALGQTEERLMRHLITYFQHAFPDATLLHKSVNEQFKQKVNYVSHKWLSLIGNTPVQTLQSDSFMERVTNSARYFRNTLHELFDQPLRITAEVTSQNKAAMKRLVELREELAAYYHFHIGLLEEMADRGFTISNYLNAKQEILLAPEKEKNEGRGREKRTASRRRRKQSVVEPKAPKEPSPTISLRMYKQGMTCEQIARERNLTLETVMRHFTTFVIQGEIPLEDFVSPDTAQAIRLARAHANPQSSLTSIKEQLPDDITYTDIRMVLTVDDSRNQAFHNPEQ